MNFLFDDNSVFTSNNACAVEPLPAKKSKTISLSDVEFWITKNFFTH
jgi:hypothetical protein